MLRPELLRPAWQASKRATGWPGMLSGDAPSRPHSSRSQAGQAANALSRQDEGLLRLFLTACNHRWKELPVAAECALDAGCSKAQLRATVRHMPIVAGYAPCLAAAKALDAGGFLGEDTPGKIGGPPGNAFELVYAKVRDRVWENLYHVDSYISESIRLHAYGDIYSSPGLDLRQKQILIVGFLGTVDMHDELFGHCLAALRFGAPQQACEAAIKIAFELTPMAAEALQQRAVKVLAGAARKVRQNFPDGLPPLPQVSIPDPESVRRPAIPAALDLHADGTLPQT